jgi:putative RNA 2'-phosphotransferase
MGRQYVHLSRAEEIAMAVGKRHGEPIVLCIAAKMMHEEEYKFYLSENKVWLVDKVSIKYIKTRSV